MKVAYYAQWIEVEFGQRLEGCCCATNKDVLMAQVRKASAEGGGGGSYLGPERPLKIYEIPFDCLEPTVAARLDAEPDSYQYTIDNNWQPKFIGQTILVPDEPKPVKKAELVKANPFSSPSKLFDYTFDDDDELW